MSSGRLLTGAWLLLCWCMLIGRAVSSCNATGWDMENTVDKAICYNTECNCSCNEILSCDAGPPTEQTADDEYTIWITGTDGMNEPLKYISSGWMSGFTVEYENETWSHMELLTGKAPPGSRKAKHLYDINIAIVIKRIVKLQIITRDAFDAVARTLTSLTILECEQLHTIAARPDFPRYPLAKLKQISFIELESLKEIDFLNSQFYNMKSARRPMPANYSASNFTIEIVNNERLRSLALKRPLTLAPGEKVDLIIRQNPLLQSGFNVCFLKGKVKRITACNMNCEGCDKMWMLAMNSMAEGSTENDFDELGYPWLASRPSAERWSFEGDLSDCDGESCNPPQNNFSFFDWPIEKVAEKSTSGGLDATILLPPRQKTACTFGGAWDPFLAYHTCFKTEKGWQTCLDGCDCMRSHMKCKYGPHYDERQKMLSVSKEDLPRLTTLARHAFSNLPENTEVETVNIHNNPFLRAISASTKMFDPELVKNAIISRCPRLERLDRFISASWINLEYLELSHLGEVFGKSIHFILGSIFSVIRPKLVVLDLTMSNLKTLPTIHFPKFAPELRYLILEGNKFKSFDLEALMPFYVLPKKVSEKPAMFIERTPRTRADYPTQKSLNIQQNRQIRCDCHMRNEHLLRVSDSKYWVSSQLTNVIFDMFCNPVEDPPGCKVKIDAETGCPMFQYKDGHMAYDMPCLVRKYSIQDEIETAKTEIGLSCTPDSVYATYCDPKNISANPYPYFYCDAESSLCKPAARDDPVIPLLKCEEEVDETKEKKLCYRFQNSELTCPDKRSVGSACSMQVLECNTAVHRCQFKHPYKRSDFRMDMCKFRIGRVLGKGYWDHKDAALAEKAWVGECGIQCKKATDCKDLDVKFPGMRFCCTNEGYCSTNCFNKCPAGRTGLLCETDLTKVPVRCPVGWGGDVCSVKLCNKFFMCQNGAVCKQFRCSCLDGYFGPECTQHQICEDNPCDNPSKEFCKSTDGKTFTCKPVSRVFAKYKFLEDSSAAMVDNGCVPSKCRSLMKNSVCIRDRCACPMGWVARKQIGKPPVCLVGAAPCDLTNPGECATIHKDMICSGNRDYIGKVEMRPVAYTSFCMCSLPLYFHTVTGACLAKANLTANAEFLKVGELDEGMSAALIAIIVLSVVAVGVAAGSYWWLRQKKQEMNLEVKQKASRTSQLHSQLSLARGSVNSKVEKTQSRSKNINTAPGSNHAEVTPAESTPAESTTPAETTTPTE